MKINQTIKIAVKNNMPCLLVGEHGTGKSYAIKEAAKKDKMKLHRVIITQETTPEDLIFQYELKDGETVAIERELLTAVKNGDWIVLEELNMASPAVLTMLNGLLETDPESRYLRYKELEIVPHKDFRLFATSNPTSYSGTNRMNDALLSRFIINKVAPDYKFFIGLVSQEYKNPDLTAECTKFVSGIQKAKKNYDIYVSPRELLIYAKLRHQKYSEKNALSFVLDRFYDLEDDVIKDIAALFDIELKREEVQILNEVEIARLVDEKVEDIKHQNEQLQNRIKELEAQTEILKKVKIAMTQTE
mgnify:CR=1 FL=1